MLKSMLNIRTAALAAIVSLTLGMALPASASNRTHVARSGHSVVKQVTPLLDGHETHGGPKKGCALFDGHETHGGPK